MLTVSTNQEKVSERTNVTVTSVFRTSSDTGWGKASLRKIWAILSVLHIFDATESNDSSKFFS